jgi:hypothetical protein
VAVWIFVLKTSKVMLHQIVEVSNKWKQTS